MKSSNQVFVSLLILFTTFGQSAIATSRRVTTLNSIDSYRASGNRSDLTRGNTQVTNSPQISTTFTPRQLSPLLKKTIVSRFLSAFPDVNSESWSVSRPLVSFVEVDLNNDGKKETIVLDRRGLRCSNRSCPIEIFKLNTQNKSYNFISETGTSRNGLEVAFLPTKSYGWQDLAIQYFSYETRTIDWYAVKFDGKAYKSSSQKLTQIPKNIILSEKSPSFDLGDFPDSQSAAPVATKPNPKISTAPDPIFKYLIPTIRRELPRDMVMRLPSFIPNVYKEALNSGQGTQVYANNAEYLSDVDGGIYAVRLARTPDCNATSCGVGSIYVSRNKPSIRDSDSGNESKDKEEPIQIKPGLSGYYFYARAGSAGYRHNIYWLQNGVYFHLNFRDFEKEEVRQMAVSMSLGSVIRPSMQTKPIAKISSPTTKPSTSISDDEDRCIIPKLPSIDVSNVKIVKNISSRNEAIEQYIRTAHTDELNYRSVSYSYNKVDLDGDGKPEILLRVSSSFCGTGGCPIEILKLNGGRYSAIDSFLSFGRFIVTSSRTNGLNDIVLPHFAQTEKEYFLLKYQSSKKRYETVKTYTKNLKVKGTAYLVCGKYHDLSK